MAKKDRPLKKLSPKKRLRRIGELVEPFRVTSGKRFRLRDYDPDDTRGLVSKEEAQEYLKTGVALLAEMQDKLYAQDQWGVLLIFQAMDAAGKDGAIKHVMSGVNPQGCQVFAFKAPTSEELDHDALWRTSKSLPERGRIGIFNRSYYEEVLVVRVHPEILEKQKLPRSLVTKRVWDERLEDIRAFERYLSRQGFLIVKFFLNVSKKAQKERFLERLEEPEKHWKFSLADAQERKHWRAYMDAYQDAIAKTATKDAPWYVVPADKKWFARLVVAGAIYEALAKLKLRYPEVGPEKKKELAAARAALMGEAKSAVRDKRRPVAKKRVVAKRRSLSRSSTRTRPATMAPPAPAEELAADTGATAADES
ncbi:MAG TPA: polyphosphate kinase 2 family protein [Vicinamibacteria bacterium]|nr:polyphosphate kinase 2 family protein [Vicinamibacteria bacterium]